MTELIEDPRKRPLTPDDKPTKKELLQTGKPLILSTGKVHAVILKPLFTVYEPNGTTPKEIKYGYVADVEVDPNNIKTPNSFLFKGRMYELMIEEYPLYDKRGLPMIFYDINGRKPISVKISDIENQKSSRFANQTWGKGHTLQNLIASIESRNSGNVIVYVILFIAGIFAGIIADHFLHI